MSVAKLSARRTPLIFAVAGGELAAGLRRTGLDDTGQPWTGRAMLSGPRTERKGPL